MYRIRVTLLESFRRYINEVSEYDTEERLIEMIKGDFKGNDKSRVGSAFHRIVEEGERAWLPSSPRPGAFAVVPDPGEAPILFNQDFVSAALNYRRARPNMTHEVPIHKIFNVPRLGQVMITGKIDGIEGRVLEDQKVQFKDPNYAEFLDSIQWKLYCNILGVDRFNYHFFQVKGWDEENPRDLTGCRLVVHEPLSCTRYNSMDQDVDSLIWDFIHYLQLKQFFPLLKSAENYEKNLIL
jgi:hypothetical protein